MKELKKWLKENDMSVIEFAKQLKLTRGQVYHILHGKRKPSLETAKEIYKLTGINWLE